MEIEIVKNEHKINNKNIENRMLELEQENKKLGEKLEVTQSVVDEIALGGVV